jgi:hypothetical protein
MIKTISSITLLVGFLFLFTGCPYGGYKFDEGRFPSEPVNFEDINSEFDDYNSTAPFIESDRYLYFSSNRNSNGGEFDIVGENVRIYWDKDHGTLTVDDSPHPWIDYDYTDSLFPAMNSIANEYGPYALPYLTYFDSSYHFTELIVYANDGTGDLDLKFVWFEGIGENPTAEEGDVSGPDSITFLNSGHNDAYLTFYGEDYLNYDYYARDISLITDLLFCSDRNGNYDIFEAHVPDGSDILNFLREEEGTPIYAVNSLNTGADEKCPYAEGNLLVFASNRPGGFGGYDLYYSLKDGNFWSAPTNFGAGINTEYNEFRPIVLYEYQFINDLMIFSSDRPGGKGGYDLYYVGIPKMTN